MSSLTRQRCQPMARPSPLSSPTQPDSTRRSPLPVIRESCCDLRPSTATSMSREPSMPCDLLPDDNQKSRKLRTGFSDLDGVDLDEKNEERSISICDTRLITFFLEVLALVLLAILAYGLRSWNYYQVYRRGFNCIDDSIKFPRQSSNLDNNSFPLADYTDEAFYGVIIGGPIATVVIVELLAGLTMVSKLSRSRLVQLAVIRAIRFSGGFLQGVLLTSIASSTIQHAVGRLRPYFLDICYFPCTNVTNLDIYIPSDARDVELCGYGSESATLIVERDLRNARMSFPSYSVSLTTFSTLFLIAFLGNQQLRKSLSWTRAMRGMISGAMLIGLILLANAKLSGNRNHLEDILFAFFLGFIATIYVVISHLDWFEEPLPTIKFKKDDDVLETSTIIGLNNLNTNSNSSNYVSDADSFVRYFQIPRAMYRGSVRWSKRWTARRKEPQLVNPVPEIRLRPMSTMGIVNPAFNGDDHSINNNRHSMDVRFY